MHALGTRWHRKGGELMAALRLRRWMVPAAAALVVVLIGVLVAHRGSPPPAYRTGRADLGTVTQSVDVTGTLQPASEVDLDFGTSGHVATVAVEAGSTSPPAPSSPPSTPPRSSPRSTRPTPPSTPPRRS